jgi:uncharacterized repeat protein (TIGR02543 family)
MKNFLSKLWSLSRTDRVRTLAIDAVSLPSFCRLNMLKLVSVFALLLTIGVGNAWADATVGTTLFSENFGDYSANDVPSGSVSSVANKREIYGGGSVTYTSVNGSYTQSGKTKTAYTKIWADNLAGGTSPELLVGKNAGTFTITGIPTGNATGITLTYMSNKNPKLSSSTTDVSFSSTQPTGTEGAHSVTITIPSNTATFNLTFTAPGDNARLDNILMVVETAGGGGGSVAVTGVSVSPTSKSIVPGETFTITPTVSPAGATNKSVSWTSGATSYATVNSSGLVTGVAAGSSTITCTTTDGSYTATCAVTVRGVTLQACDEDGNAIAGGGPGAPTRSGATITAAANSGNYVFKQWQVTNASVASTTATPTTISNPTGAVTVTAVYYKPITITYKANGSTFTTQTYARGGTLAFPVSNPDGATYSCTGKTFVGWVGEANKDYSDASTPPTYATAGGSVTAAATYYAVFATASGGGGYEQVTSLSSIHEGSAYFAYYGSYSGTRWYGVNAVNTVIAPVDVTTGVLTTSKTGDGAYTLQEFTLVAVDASNYEYYIKIGNKYVTASGDKTDLSVGNDAYLWKFNSINSTNYNLEILHDASTDYYIKVGVGSATGGKFRSYTSSGQQVSLFQSSTTYSNYATSCCTALGTINGSVTSSNLSQSNGVLTATLPNASKNANATSYRFTLYNNSDVEITHTDVATGSGDVSTTFSSPNVTAGNTYKVSVTPLVSPQGAYCSTTGTESDKASITMHYTVTLAVNNAEYGSISPTSTLYVASGTSISASTNTLSVGATNITATYSDQTAQYTYGFTNWTWSPSGATITANTTATANFSRSTRTYNVTTTGITHATASPAIPATVAYGGSISTTITAESGYHLPTSITVSGASSTWDSSTGELTISSVTGDVTITITGEENSCDGYSFHTGGSDVWNTRAENKCFVQDGVTKRWYISNYTITSNTHFCLNWQGGKYDRGGDNNVRFMTQPWTEMSLAYGRSGKVGVATGAVGTIQMYANSSDDNLYVGFIPDGYVLKYNGVDEVMTQSSTYVWYAPTPYTLNSTTQGYTAAVGLNDGSDNYVACDNTAAVKHIFVKVDHSDWTAASAKYEIYNIQTSTFVGEYMRVVPGETNLYEGWIPSGCTSIIIARCNPGADIPTGNTWTNVWNQTQNITLDGSKNYYTINSKDGSNKYYGAWSVYEKSGKWYLDLDGTTTGGQKNFSCYFYPHYVLHYDANSGSGAPADQSVALDASPCQLTVSSTVPTRAGYTFLGWNQSSSATIPDGDWDGGDTHAMTGDVTLYAVWAANHTLTYNYNGGDGSSCSGGTKYTGESFTACSSAGDKEGHTFTGWLGSNSVSYTAGSSYSMPDADLTLTAQWSVNSYDVTLTTNGGTINAGNVTSYTYGTGATLPTNVTRDGYRFDGWFTDDGVWSDQVTAISTTATGDKTYYAKWTQVYTVTWSVNGETSTEQVVSGEKVASLPTAPTSSDCDDSKVFVGWKAAEIDGVSVSNPGGIFTTQAGSPEISANTTFYAVFADVSGGDITLVTNVSELTNGTQVYIYSTFEASENTYGAVAKAYDGSSNNVKATSGTVSSNKLTPGEGACLYTIGTATYNKTDGYTFNDGTNYLRATGSDKNYLVGAASLGDDGKGVFSISITAGVFSISSIGNTSRGVMQFNKNGDTGAYDKALFACYETASQRNVQLFKKNPLVYSNYVTSCSSCDADATFTNTTPAVSDIDCTSATLTATGGLATVGADGCHVSDYGFVIGTSDNPVIGGSGVTKLQVGTSDPTIGEDFSYDATGLTKGTHYYIRAYATNRHGTAYSGSQNFWTNNVSSIAITTAPTKTNYIVGETFDATGMVVTATMASGATEDVTSDVTYSSSALTAGTSQNFPINYTLCETEKSVNQVINVYTLSVTEGTNPTYGTATNSSANIVSITGLGDHKTYTVTVTSSNATAVDNGDNTWSIINPTGNVTVRVDYADAVQVKVYYKVDGVTVTGLTQDVYQSETTTLPTASELATAMTAQSMDLPDDDYPNFVGWSETEFPAQTAEPTIVTGTPTINAEKTYYAVYTNLSQVQIEYSITSGYAAEANKTIDGQTITYGYLYPGNNSGTRFVQFQKDASNYGRIYNSTSMANLIKLEAGYYNSESDIPVYACSAAGTITGSAISAESHEGSDPYVYTFPSNTSYFMVKGNNSTTFKPKWLKIYYCSSTVYYMTQFCTRYTITGASTSGTAVTGGTLTSSYNSTCEGKSMTLSAAVNAGYAFGGWTITGASSGDMTSTLLGANASSVTPPAFTMPAENITVSATITEKKVTGWTFTNHIGGAEITSTPIVVYVDQKVQLDIAYSPEPLLSSHKANTQYDYTRSDDDSYIKSPSKATDKFSFIGKASTNGTTTSITLTHNDDSDPATFAKTINVEVRALPTDKFLDLVHGVEFDDQAATLTTSEGVTNGGVVFTYTAPGGDQEEWSTPYANTCEQKKVKLVGWVESEYADACIAADSFPTTDALKADSEHFFEVGTTMTASNKTYYAVWAEKE